MRYVRVAYPLESLQVAQSREKYLEIEESNGSRFLSAGDGEPMYLLCQSRSGLKEAL